MVGFLQEQQPGQSGRERCGRGGENEGPTYGSQVRTLVRQRGL